MSTKSTTVFRLFILLLVVVPASISAIPDLVFKDTFEDLVPCTGPEPVECDLRLLHFPGMHINEVAPIKHERGIKDVDGTAPPMQWIELYRDLSSAIDLSNLAVSFHGFGIILPLPAATMDGGDFFTIWLLPGGTIADDFGLTNDLDLSDGQGHWYIDGGSGMLENGDDIALIDSGPPSKSNALVDPDQIHAFFAYGAAFEATSDLETAAVAAGLWQAGSRFDLGNTSPGEGISLYIDGFYPGEASAIPGPTTLPVIRSADDFLSIPWVEQTAGIPQPNQPIQVSPRDGQMLAALPVGLNWRSCPGASSYLVEIFDSEDPGAVAVQRITATNSYTVDVNDIAANPIYWTVACLYAGNTRRTLFPPRWSFALGAAPGGGPGGRVLNIAHQYQRKDTNMLCLYDNEKGNGYGCEEIIAGPTGACNWDSPHNVSSAAAVRACGPISENNCVRASIQMAHKFLAPGLTLSQDYISHLTFSGKNPPGVAVAADPEGDLGAGTGMRVAETVSALSTLLNVGAGSITVDTDPSFTDIKGWIDADRPVIIFRYWHTQGGHATVVYGYQITPFNAVLVHDPTDGPGLVMRWGQYSSRNLRSNTPVIAIVPPAAPGAAPIGNPPNTIHTNASASVFNDLTDGDGIVNFDEIYRFFTDKDDGDTDFDQVGDKEEVFSYTFPLGKNTIISHVPDLDGDLKRAELDCSTDAVSNFDHDGGEDINGNGGKGEPGGVGPGETDVFNPGDGVRQLMLDKSEYFVGEDVRLSGGTLHGNYAYGVTTLPVPPIPDNTPLGGGGVFNTDSSGNGNDVIFTCPGPGMFISYVDIADEGIWQETDQKCDASLPFLCRCFTFDPPEDVIDVPGGLFVAIPPVPMFDIIELTNASTVGQEVNLGLTVTATGPVPPTDLFTQFIFEVAGTSPAQPVPFPWTEGGGVWVDVAFPGLGPPLLQVLVWDASINQWVPDPVLQGQVQVNLLPVNPPVEIMVEIVMPGLVNLPLTPPQQPIVGVRALTGEQPFVPQFLDVMPEPFFVANPTGPDGQFVFQQFIDLASCGPVLEF